MVTMSAASSPQFIAQRPVRTHGVPLLSEKAYYCTRCLSHQVYIPRHKDIWQRILTGLSARVVKCRQCFTRSTFW